MKTHRLSSSALYLVVVWTLLLCSPVARSAPSTNDIFMTSLIDGELCDKDSEALEKTGRHASTEILPADQDPKGNWGPAIDGSQMSVRLYQQSFTNGEAVPVVIIWRNLSNSGRSWSASKGVEHYPFELILRRDGELLTPVIPRVDPDRKDKGWGATGSEIAAHSQFRFSQRLDRVFDLTQPGTYELMAERREPAMSKKEAIVVHSGHATFRVLPKPERGSETKSPGLQPK